MLSLLVGNLLSTRPRLLIQLSLHRVYTQGNYNKTSDENISALSANDPADEALYAAAKSRFWSDVRRYAVTPASCRARGCSTD